MTNSVALRFPPAGIFGTAGHFDPVKGIYDTLWRIQGVVRNVP